jgi:sugar phosphate isomerase/epimerase
MDRDCRASLGAEGLEMYEGFFTSLDDGYIDSVGEAIAADRLRHAHALLLARLHQPGRRPRASSALDHEVEMIRVTRRLGGPGAACRVLSGQRYPEVSRAQGVAWVLEAIESTAARRPHEYDVVLAMENHYKDGFWRWPEFAQKMDVFLEIVDAVARPHPLRRAVRPVQRHRGGRRPHRVAGAGQGSRRHDARQRPLPGAGRHARRLRQTDGTIGYFAKLKHGVTGKGLNDYDRIFAILKSVDYQGWISIEDGMNGMEEMKESIDFLKLMRDRYFA